MRVLRKLEEAEPLALAEVLPGRLAGTRQPDREVLARPTSGRTGSLQAQQPDNLSGCRVVRLSATQSFPAAAISSLNFASVSASPGTQRVMSFVSPLSSAAA